MDKKKAASLYDAEHLFKEATKESPEWYNVEGVLHHYLSNEEFGRSNAARETKARQYVASRLKNRPNEFWRKKSEELQGPFVEMMGDDIWETDQRISKEHNLFDFLLKQRPALRKKLNDFADLLLSEPASNVFPVDTIEFLIYTREKVYEMHVSILKKEFQAKDDDILDFRKEWLILEQEKADRIIEAIKADKIILTKKLAHTGTLRKYKDYLQEQFESKNAITAPNENNDFPEKPSYLGYALLHHYWHKHTQDESKLITTNTKRRWSNHYGIKEVELWKQWRKIFNDGKDPSPGTHHKTKAAFITQYELILPTLKDLCPPAYNDVNQKLNRLKKG